LLGSTDKGLEQEMGWVEERGMLWKVKMVRRKKTEIEWHESERERLSSAQMMRSMC
jgi:hypothetical protein